MIVTEAQFTTWLASIGLADPPGVAATALGYAIDEVTSFCGRGFVYSPEDGGKDEARTYAGSGEPFLVIDDCLEVVSVAVDGADVGAAAFETHRAGSGPIIYLKRVTGAFLPTPISFGTTLLAGYWPSGATITVTGQWGYAATTPPSVVEAVCQLALARMMSGRLWQNLGVQKSQVLTVSVQFSQADAKAKAAEALALVAALQRVEKEPSLA